MSVGTELYRRAIAYPYENPEFSEVTRRVWSPTPWLVDVFTDRVESERARKIKNWCRAVLGDEAWGLRDRPGNWQRGSATIFGWTWYGFANEDLMEQFLERWPSDEFRSVA